MTDRRLLFYNDARHFYMYCYDPPIRLEEAWTPIDEVAGTRVDTFVYCYGAGQTLFLAAPLPRQKTFTEPSVLSLRFKRRRHATRCNRFPASS